jgi:acyl carrier protein
VAQGYWQRRELSDKSFVPCPIETSAERSYRSGDQMMWTADGKLDFLGRVDEQVKLRGFRIEPGEIEAALNTIDAITEAAAVVRDPGQLVAFAVTGGAVGNWREALAERLPDFMIPSRLVELAELPRLPNGKVDRRRLEQIMLPTQSAEAKPPQILGEREQALTSLWEGLLGQVGIGVDDNFFQLGGHSLLVVEMAVAIERDFGVEVAPSEIFQCPTIRQLSARIEQSADPAVRAYAHLFPLQPGGRKAPFLFCVPHFFSHMAATRFRGERPVYGLRGVSLRQEGNRGRWRTMRELGEELVTEIRRRFPDRPVIVAGYSFGATMAVEAVRLMEEQGIPVQKLYLIAPMAIDFYRVGPFRFQIDTLRQPVGELSLGQALLRFVRNNHPFTRRAYRRAWRLLAIQPWRLGLCFVGRIRKLVGLQLTPGILYADVRVERFRLHAGYRPGTVKTPTVIFNAREPETDAAATWRPFFEGSLSIVEIPDPHFDEASIAAAKDVILDHLADVGDQEKA